MLNNYSAAPTTAAALIAGAQSALGAPARYRFTARDLVASAMAGEPAAVARLLEQQRRRIIALAAFFTRNSADVEDLAQDILLRLMLALPTLTTPDTFDVWIYRLSRNRCIDHFRRRRYEAGWPETATDDVSPLWTVAPRRADASLETTEAVGRLRTALARLPPAWRRAIVLRDLREKSYEEVAEQLGLPLGTVKSQISRGRARLALLLVQ